MACTARFDGRAQRFRDPMTGRFVWHDSVRCLHVSSLELGGLFTDEGARVVLTEQEHREMRRQMLRALFTPTGAAP